MKTYCVFLLTTSLLLPAFDQPSVLPSAQAFQASTSAEKALTSIYKPQHTGIPGRRVGAGTR